MGGCKESTDNEEILSFPKIHDFLKINFSPEQFEHLDQYQKYNDKSYDANDDIFQDPVHAHHHQLWTNV